MSASACDKNPRLELKNCFLGLTFLSNMRALMRALYLGFRSNILQQVMYSNGYKFSYPKFLGIQQNKT